MLKQLVIFTSFIYLSSCISIGFKKEEVLRDTNVLFQQPNSPFQEFEAMHLDKAWRNSKNGNSISYLSECNKASDPSLKVIHKGIVKGLDNAKTESMEFKKYNHRKALFSDVTGEVDGVESKMKIVILKKNSCLYILTYVALAKTFNEDANTFDQFVERFEVK